MFLPEDIDLGNAQKYTLTIRIKSDGFSFLIQDSTDKDSYTYQETAFTHNESLAANVQKVVFDLNFLTDSFKNVNVIVVTSAYEQIPSKYFDSKALSHFYNFSHNKESEHVLAHEHLTDEFKSIFDINNEMYLFLKRSLCSPSFYLHSGILIDYIQKRIIEAGQNSMFINFHGDFADIICFNKNKNFLYAQSYIKEEESNIVYYALNMWEKLGLDQHSDCIYIYGALPEMETASLLRKYIENVKNIGLKGQNSDSEGESISIPLDVLILSE